MSPSPSVWPLQITLFSLCVLLQAFIWIQPLHPDGILREIQDMSFALIFYKMFLQKLIPSKPFVCKAWNGRFTTLCSFILSSANPSLAEPQVSSSITKRTAFRDKEKKEKYIFSHDKRDGQQTLKAEESLVNVRSRWVYFCRPVYSLVLPRFFLFYEFSLPCGVKPSIKVSILVFVGIKISQQFFY